jgi:hypothetical protein
MENPTKVIYFSYLNLPFTSYLTTNLDSHHIIFLAPPLFMMAKMIWESLEMLKTLEKFVKTFVFQAVTTFCSLSPLQFDSNPASMTQHAPKYQKKSHISCDSQLFYKYAIFCDQTKQITTSSIGQKTLYKVEVGNHNL